MNKRAAEREREGQGRSGEASRMGGVNVCLLMTLEAVSAIQGDVCEERGVEEE